MDDQAEPGHSGYGQEGKQGPTRPAGCHSDGKQRTGDERGKGDGAAGNAQADGAGGGAAEEV